MCAVFAGIDVAEEPAIEELDLISIESGGRCMNQRGRRGVGGALLELRKKFPSVTILTA